jgi:hypothetical protein
MRRHRRRDLALDGLDGVVRVRPLRSIASIVLAKSGAAGCAAIASISAVCSASARSKAGRKCSIVTLSKGGAPKGPCHDWKKGLAAGWAVLLIRALSGGILREINALQSKNGAFMRHFQT